MALCFDVGKKIILINLIFIDSYLSLIERPFWLSFFPVDKEVKQLQ
jgi:hypothetical protein